ncbi:MAG: thioredoxin-like domain-containing protein [Flavobacterium sp.]
MKKIIPIVVLAAIIFAFTNTAKSEFSKTTLSQNLVTIENTEIPFKKILKKHTGKVTVIEIWASWCSDCVKAMPKLKELQANNPNVDYVFISLDKTYEKWQAGMTKYEMKGDNYWVSDGMKGEFGKSIDLDWVPRYIILDKKGKIATYRAVETEFDKMNETLKTLE